MAATAGRDAVEINIIGQLLRLHWNQTLGEGVFIIWICISKVNIEFNLKPLTNLTV